jgi:excisionase family DNA binding protein
MQLSIQEAAIALAVSPNTIRRRLAKGVITGTMVDNKWLIDIPEEEPPALAIDNELVKQLRADLANAGDRITFLEGHISQLTNALPPAPPAPKPKSQSWWSKMWRGE